MIVGPESELYTKKFFVKELNMLSDDLGEEFNCHVKLRSTHKPVPALVRIKQENNAEIELIDGYKGVTPGQACVMYEGTRVIGGGWITQN